MNSFLWQAQRTDWKINQNQLWVIQQLLIIIVLACMNAKFFLLFSSKDVSQLLNIAHDTHEYELNSWYHLKVDTRNLHESY